MRLPVSVMMISSPEPLTSASPSSTMKMKPRLTPSTCSIDQSVTIIHETDQSEAVIAGIALGVARRQTSAWFLLLAFASHKWVISGCLGLKWARSAVCGHKTRQSVLSSIS